MSAVGNNLCLKVDPYIVYPGAKWTMAQWIMRHMPPHQIYLEPFAGSCAVFFNKARSDIETLNDVNGDIINLFRVMREHLDALLFAIEMTPWSREEFDTSYDLEGLSAVERARKFLVRCWQAHKPKLGQRTGWKKDTSGLHRKYYTRQWSRALGVGLPSRVR
ncbi:MAG: DNA adenine methylase [Dissulfurispiraceae bacterium]